MPPAATGFSPLDAELGLLPNHRFTPRLEETMARLGTALDFVQAAGLLAFMTGVVVSEATVRRRTYAAGEAALADEAADLAQIEQTLPEAPVAPARVQLSIDATKVPLVGGEWTDMKLAVVGELVPSVDDAGEPTVTAVNLSYAARWEPAATFAQTLTLEAHRRGLDRAQDVASPNDGADWIQGVLDLVAPAAVRILDEPHAAEHLGLIGSLVYGAGSAAAAAWTSRQRERLRTEPPAGVLATLDRCLTQGPWPGAAPGADGQDPAAVLAREVAYFHKRAEQIRYAAFRAAAYPIGSGIVESGHKVVIGDRFKKAGQHWAPPHLSPLAVLRTVVCNDRWAVTWPRIWVEQQRTVRMSRQTAHARRQALRRSTPPPMPPHPPAPVIPAASTRAPVRPPADPPPAPATPSGRRPPTATHPWRRPLLHPRRTAA